MKTMTALGRLLLVLGVLGLFPAEPIHAGCSDPIGNERDMRYNDEYHTYEFCDGTQWVSMGKPIPGRGGGGFFVITKTVYDGNFDTYIADFTKNIGPVFDLIFKFTKNPPPSPCRKHLQEFIDFAAAANRVPIGFYQAYPGLSVQDIHALIADSKPRAASGG